MSQRRKAADAAPSRRKRAAEAPSPAEVRAGVRRYLTELDQARQARRRRQRPERLMAELSQVEERLGNGAGPLDRLHLSQRRLDLKRRLAELERADDQAAALASAEDEFVSKFGAAYASARGITFRAWVDWGVPADVLRRAGIPERAPR